MACLRPPQIKPPLPTSEGRFLFQHLAWSTCRFKSVVSPSLQPCTRGDGPKLLKDQSGASKNEGNSPDPPRLMSDCWPSTINCGPPCWWKEGGGSSLICRSTGTWTDMPAFTMTFNNDVQSTLYCGSSDWGLMESGEENQWMTKAGLHCEGRIMHELQVRFAILKEGGYKLKGS